MSKKILLIFAAALLISCQNQNKQETNIEDTSAIYDKIDSISHAALKAKVTETELDFGFKFGMSCKEVKRILAGLSPEDGDLDTYYTVALRNTNYGVSITPKYRNGKLYSLKISFLSKNKDKGLSESDINRISDYYITSTFKKRNYKTFNYSDIGDSISIAYKDNIICEMRNVGNTVLDLSFVNKAAEREKNVSTFAGTYYCARTHDTYHFDDDGTGYFTIQGGVSKNTFTWIRHGTKVNITYTGDAASFGKQTLGYVKEHNLLTEKTKDFGILSFDKKKD